MTRAHKTPLLKPLLATLALAAVVSACATSIQPITPTAPSVQDKGEPASPNSFRG